MTSKLSRRPIYAQVRDALVERIRSGEWTPAQPIPSEVELARQFGVSPGTMRKALDALETEQVVTRLQGRGTFINDANSGRLAQRYLKIRDERGALVAGSVKSMQVRREAASADDRRRLQLEDGAQVWRVERVRLHDGRPFMFERISLPATLFPVLSEADRDDIVGLAAKHGLLLGTAQERVSFAPVWPEAASALGLPPTLSVAQMDRVVLAIDGSPAEWRLAQCLLTSYHYVSEMM